MNHFRSLCWCVFVLACVPSLATAAEPSLVEWTQQRVIAGIVKPLAERSGRSLSRSRPPPHESRVRVPQTTLSRDAQGREFVPFAVDIRYGKGKWQTDTVGCAYRTSGNLFVKIGDAYYPAVLLLGKQVDPVAAVCQSAAARS